MCLLIIWYLLIYIPLLIPLTFCGCFLKENQKLVNDITPILFLFSFLSVIKCWTIMYVKYDKYVKSVIMKMFDNYIINDLI